MTIVGSRPKIIMMSSIIRKADKYFDQMLVRIGQNYDNTLNEFFLKDFELREFDYCLGVVGERLDHNMGNLLAKRLRISIFHMGDYVIQRCTDIVNMMI